MAAVAVIGRDVFLHMYTLVGCGRCPTADLGPKFRGAKCSVEGRICERKTFLVGFVCFVGLDDNT